MADDKLKKFINSRQKKLEDDKVSHNERMQDVADYVCPHREDILGNRQRGDKKGGKIFDGTAVSAAVLAADGIHGYHVSPAFPWFKYLMNRKQTNNIQKVREWLEECEYAMYMALNRSNFYSEMWPFIYDGFTIGTADMTVEEDLAEDRLVFEAVHPGEIFIEENKYGEIDVVHRKRKLTARKIRQMFGKETSLPDMVKNAYENNPFSEFEIIHAVYPREDFDDRRLDSKSKRFASVWMLKVGPDGGHICRESGFDRFQHSTWRYLKSGKEVYGYSPAVLAMADIKGLNLMNKTLLGAAQMTVDPPYNIPAYLEGKVQLIPRGKNFLRDPNDRITPVNTGAGFPVGIDREQAKQKAIQERFHVDTFLMIANMEGSRERTRYEVQQMMKEKAAVLGAELGPLNTALDRLLDLVFDIEQKAGRIPPPPPELVEMGRQDKNLRFDPVYMGPLAQAQREAFAKDGLLNFINDIAPLAQVNPDVLDNIDMDKAALHLADVDNVPFGIIRPVEERDRIREAKAQATQAATAKEDLERLAAGGKDLAKADKDSGGMIQDMIGAMSASA